MRVIIPDFIETEIVRDYIFSCQSRQPSCIVVLVGKGQRTISEFENGETRVFATDLAVFANILDVPITYFLGDSDQDSLDELMMHEFRQLSTLEGRQSAIDLVRVLRRFAEKE